MIETLPSPVVTNANTRVRSVTRLMQCAVAAALLLQRFCLPVYSFPLVQVVIFALLGLLLYRRAIVAVPWRAVMYALAIVVCLIAAIGSVVLLGRPASLNSLLLLILLYIPFIAQVKPEFRVGFRRVLSFYSGLVAVLACVAIGQWVAQMLGWKYSDLLGSVPSKFLISGFNTSYPVHYGSDTYKANGVFFLEPSFCSQAMGLAIIIQLYLREHLWRIALFAGALLATVSGTGLIVLAVGLLALAGRLGLRRFIPVLLCTVAVVVAISLTPAGKLFSSRSNEVGQQGSSGNSRFVQPYTLTADGLLRDTGTFLVGRGPGSIGRAGSEFFNSDNQAATYPPIPKLAAEYGVPAAFVFSAFIFVSLVKGSRIAAVTVPVVVGYFVLSGNLLTPHTVLLAFLLVSAYSGVVDQPVARREHWPGRSPRSYALRPLPT